MIHFVLLISRQGKVRLTKWYSPYSQKERTKVIREHSGMILSRGPKLCNFVEWRGYKVVYKRYASLYFCMCIDQDDNELEVLEIIHHFVEILDRYFGSVCELDLIFNFHKAYYILDEILIAGELQESSKKTVARLIAAQVLLWFCIKLLHQSHGYGREETPLQLFGLSHLECLYGSM
ncbi:AP-1 complex subunit sigma-2-like [Olea europaea var. sylvestris]|uniref:AP-1 complex subunit sigma-2-like n=1 Tax=Olea europaea var. sylvestris TaxID=158386 RepID=UPI000C1D46B9|nr:AP-1 complex subunit sigma-2-like [Olea europaea var. sylvestris]